MTSLTNHNISSLTFEYLRMKSLLYLIVQAGGCAGLSVDMILYPLDTVKTRLQSEPGLFRSGGFRGVYQGIGSVSIASVPGGKNKTWSLIINVPKITDN